MAFDDLLLNRVSRRPGLVQPVASGERATIYGADDGVIPRLEKLERELEDLRTKVRATMSETIALAGVGGMTPAPPSGLQVVDQTIVSDAHGQTWVEVEISWVGTADMFEISVARFEL